MTDGFTLMHYSLGTFIMALIHFLLFQKFFISDLKAKLKNFNIFHISFPRGRRPSVRCTVPANVIQSIHNVKMFVTKIFNRSFV